MSDPLDLEDKTDRVIRGVATSAEHLERLTYFLDRLLRRSDSDPGARELASSLEKIERATESLRSCLDHERRATEVTTRCAQHMLEQIDSGVGAPDQPRERVLSGRGPGIEIPELLELLSSHRKTGTLRAQTADETFTLEICEGDIIHATSDSPPAGARLGNILVARGVLDAETLEEFFAAHGPAAGNMGEALKSERLVTEDELRAALEHQVQELFHRLFSGHDYEFSFWAGATPTPEHHVRMNVVQLLLESARSLDEECALPTD